MGAGSRIAAKTRIAALDGKGSKSSQFDAIATRQGLGDLVENSVHDLFDIAAIKMGVAIRKPLHEFRFDHVCPQLALERPIVVPDASVDDMFKISKCNAFRTKRALAATVPTPHLKKRR